MSFVEYFVIGAVVGVVANAVRLAWRALCFERVHTGCGGQLRSVIGASDMCEECGEPVVPWNWEWQRQSTVAEFVKGAAFRSRERGQLDGPLWGVVIFAVVAAGVVTALLLAASHASPGELEAAAANTTDAGVGPPVGLVTIPIAAFLAIVVGSLISFVKRTDGESE